MEEKCNIPLYSTSGLMHIVRYVFIRKTYGGSRQAVVLGCFSFFNCQAVTCEPRDFSPHSTTFMWVLNFFCSFFFSFAGIMRRSKKGEKCVRRSSRLCRSLWLDRCCHPLRVSCLWKNRRKTRGHQSPFNTMTVLNLLLLSLQYNYFTLLPRPLEPSSHSLCNHIYISILVTFTMYVWSVHMVQARIERRSFGIPVSTEPLKGWKMEESKGCVFLKKKKYMWSM